MVERSIAWLVADNNRRVRFRGVEKNQLGLSLRIAAINLRRLVNLGLDPRRRHGGSGGLNRTRKPGSSKKGPLLGHCPSWVAGFNPFHAGASVGHIPDLLGSNIRLVA